MSGSLPETARWRDLFPLPVCDPVLGKKGMSTSARRRRCRVNRVVTETNDAIGVLNEIYAAPSDRNFPDVCTRSQQLSQHRIFKQIARMDHGNLTCKEREAVIEELLQSSPAYSGQEPTTVRTFDRSLVSVPCSESARVPAAGLLDDMGRETVEDPSRCMLLSDEEWGEVSEANKDFRPYMDVKLQHSAKEYEGFVKDIYDAGMVEFIDRPRDLVTPFFVAKKSGQQRLVLDCRGVNRRFRQPPAMSMSSGSSWASLSIPDHQQMFVAQSDIKNYFYALEMPCDLRTLFSLPSVPAGCLRSWNVPQHLGGEKSVEGRVFPCLRVVPMGWNWAMWISQRIHSHQCLVATGLSEDRLLVDKRPAPDLNEGVVLIPYADNLNVAGLSKREVQETEDCIVEHLRKLGFTVHEELDATNVAESLGYRVDGVTGIVQPIPNKLAKVRHAFKWLSKRPRVDRKIVEKLIGHAIHFMMVRRELLSLFRNLYDFVHHGPQQPCRLWRSAAREARWVSVLLSLCSANLRTPWRNTVTASDASLSGIAVCKRDMCLTEVQDIGAQHESWRFKAYDPSKNPRHNTVEQEKLDVFADASNVKALDVQRVDPYCFNEKFQEIPKDVMDKSKWQFCFASRMQHPERITLLEGRGIVAALRHKFRNSDSFGHRHLHLNDNLAAVLISEKGRSGAIEMLRVSRRIAALLIAAGSSLVTRWIPSEWNVADEGSRRWEAERRSKEGGSSMVSKIKDAFIYPHRSGPEVNSAIKAAIQSSCQGLLFVEQANCQRGSESDSKERQRGKDVESSRCCKAVDTTTTVSGSDFSGTEDRFRGSRSRLCSEASDLSSVLFRAEVSHKDQSQFRRSLMHPSQRKIHGRSRHLRSNKDLCSRHRCQARLWPEGRHASFSSSSTRLEPAGPRRNKTTTALGHEMLRAGCSSSGSPVQLLSEARRGPSTKGARPGASFQWVESSLSQSPSTRPEGDLQNKHVGRDDQLRLQDHSSTWIDTSKGFARKAQLAFDQGGSPLNEEGVGEGSSSLRSHFRSRSVVPTEAFRSEPRQVDEPQNHGRDQSPWQMALRQFSAALRKSRKGRQEFHRLPSQTRARALEAEKIFASELQRCFFQTRKRTRTAG